MKKILLLVLPLLFLTGCCAVLPIPFLCGDGAPPPSQPPPQSNPACGNWQVEFQEQCDDGNTQSGDGCDSSCQNETPLNVIDSPDEGSRLTQEEICRNQTSTARRDNCWLDLAISTGDDPANNAYCSNISTIQGQNLCWDQLARSIPNSYYCDNILDQQMRSNCQLATQDLTTTPQPTTINGVTLVSFDDVENPTGILTDGSYTLMKLEGTKTCPPGPFNPQGYFCKHTEKGYFTAGWVLLQYEQPVTGKITLAAGSYDENCQDPNHEVCDTSGGITVQVTDNYQGENTAWEVAVGNWQVPGDNTPHTYSSANTHTVDAMIVSRGPGGPGRSDVRVYSIEVE